MGGKTKATGPLTARGIQALKPGQWAADPGARGAGRLQVIKLKSGGLGWYFRYTRTDGNRDTLPLGTDLTLAEARSQAAALSRQYQAGSRDLRVILEAEEAARNQARQATAAAEELERRQAENTLGSLLMAYCDQLERSGKESATQIRKALKRHVETPWPEVWGKQATHVDPDDLLQVIARLVDAGKLREAGKQRSYIRAAYSAAISARHDPASLEQLRALKITSNPARDLVTISGSSQPRERNLTMEELRSYWKHISNPSFRYGAMMRFHLLTGAQRITQLSRARRPSDVDLDTKTIRLFDKKGRRKVARIHDVPLIDDALSAMIAMGDGPFVFSLTNGATPANLDGMGDGIDLVNQLMCDAGELHGGRFTARDIRRTVETRLAAAGISLEDRGHLQSHGLGGVQKRHYDKYARIEEMRTALITLRGLLDTPKRASRASLKSDTPRPA